MRERVVSLRKRNLSVYDIRDELEHSGKDRLSVTAIQEVLREEGFARLPRRLDEERPNRPRPMADAIADVRMFSPFSPASSPPMQEACSCCFHCWPVWTSMPW